MSALAPLLRLAVFLGALAVVGLIAAERERRK